VNTMAQCVVMLVTLVTLVMCGHVGDRWVGRGCDGVVMGIDNGSESDNGCETFICVMCYILYIMYYILCTMYYVLCTVPYVSLTSTPHLTCLLH